MIAAPPASPSAISRVGLPKGFSVCFYDEGNGETVACPRDYSVEKIGRQHYLFRRGLLAYSVDLEEASCTCPDFMIRCQRGTEGGEVRMGKIAASAGCKHLRLARALARRGRLDPP